MAPHPTLFLKRGVYDKHGLYDLTFSISADYDFIIRVFKDKSLRIEHLPKVITNMRVGGASNKNLKNIFIKMKEDYYIIRKNNIGGLKTLFFKNISKLKQFKIG
jgi:glycosyltransferase